MMNSKKPGTRSRVSIVAIAAVLLSVGRVAVAQDFTVGPTSIFTGCTDDARAPLASSDPRDRIEQRNEGRVDKITQRRFASFSMDEIEAGAAADLTASCWARLDGVWRDSMRVSLDRSFDNPDIWGASSREALALTNGTYTTPKHLVIVETRDPESSLLLAPGLTGERFVRFDSSDGVPFAELFRRGGPRKTYVARNRSSLGERLTIDVTRSGRIRLRLGDRSFYRPESGVPASAIDSQIADDDVFLIGYQMENLAASRRGYDIVTQDPFLLNANNKAEVFAEPGATAYVIDEKHVVPLGYKLVVDDQMQGMAFKKTVVSSESEIQNTLSHTLGGRLEGAGFAGPVPVSAAVSVSHTQATVDTLAESHSVAMAIGYSRTKKYSLVLDHPYIELSDEFVDAVEDARRDGNYDALIRRFGTHYPYAVTYGAAARLSQSFTEDQYIHKAQTEWGIEASVEGQVGYDILGGGGSADFKMLSGESTSTRGSYGEENAEFFGVGGNGSWNENGWMAGDTPYPILLDLRPLSELLNPMNFPGEPQIYDTVRLRLHKAIVGYVQRNSRNFSAESGLPKTIAMPLPEQVAPAKPRHRYLVYIRRLWCTGVDSGRAKSVQATKLTITDQRSGRSTVKTSGMKVDCKMINPPRLKIDYGSGDPGLLSIDGTEDELRASVIDLVMEWDYNPGKKVRTDKRSLAGELYGMSVNQTKDIEWTVSGVALPDYKLHIRIKRKR